MLEAVQRGAPRSLRVGAHDGRRRRRWRAFGETEFARVGQAIQKLRQEHRAGNIGGVRLHPVVGEDDDPRILRRGLRDASDGTIHRLHEFEQRVTSGFAEIPIQRVIGMAQMPEVMLAGVNLAEIRQEQVPPFAREQVDAGGGAPLDAGFEPPLELLDARLIAHGVHVVFAERGVLAMLGDDLREQFRRARVAGAPRGVRSPAEDLNAVEILRELGLRHVEDGHAVVGTKPVERLVVGELVRCGFHLVVRAKPEGRPVPVLAGTAASQESCIGGLGAAVIERGQPGVAPPGAKR